jgi:hypothetical protein
LDKNKQLVKLFIVLFFCTAFIFSFSHFGAQAFEKITNADGKYSEGTLVGSIDVSGKSEEETISLLEEKYVEWVKNTKIELQYSEKIVPFDINLFHFDATETVNSINDGTQNTASITIEFLEVDEQLKSMFSQVNSNEIELTKLTADLNNTAAQFTSGAFTFNINTDYLIVDIQKQVVISESVLVLKDLPFDLQSVIEDNSEIRFGKDSTFSLIEFAKQRNLEKSSSLNLLATAIYQAILPTNFTIKERNISSSLPEYAKLGYEAMVNVAKGADLVIENPNKSEYILELKIDNNNLIATIKGGKFLYEYEISKKDEQQLKPKTIVQYSPLLPKGTTHVQTAGKEGKIVKVFRNIYQGSQFVESQLLSEDYYPPAYRVEIHALAGEEQTQTTEQNGSGTDTPNTATNPNGIQTPSTTGDNQQDTEDNLWGKPNEQPK